MGIEGTAQKLSESREQELKTFLGTRGFINGEQGIKSKKIKGSREHVPPLGGAPVVQCTKTSIDLLTYLLKFFKLPVLKEKIRR